MPYPWITPREFVVLAQAHKLAGTVKQIADRLGSPRDHKFTYRRFRRLEQLELIEPKPPASSDIDDPYRRGKPPQVWHVTERGRRVLELLLELQELLEAP